MKEAEIINVLKKMERTLSLFRDDITGQISFYERTIKQSEEILTLDKKLDKAYKFIDAIKSQTQEWDKLCDCGMDDNVHDDGCMTMKARLDENNL